MARSNRYIAVQNKKPRHKWNGKLVSKARDSSTVACLKCGVIRQYVGGFPTYFKNDIVYDKISPPCTPDDAHRGH